MLEFAFVLPIILVTLTGIIAFGLVLNQYEMLTNAVSAGARAFAMSRSGGSLSAAPDADPCAFAVKAIKGAAPNLNWTETGISMTMIYTPVNGSSVTTNTSGTCPDLVMAQQDTVQVQVTYPVNATAFLWGTHQLTLTAQTMELVN